MAFSILHVMIFFGALPLVFSQLNLLLPSLTGKYSVGTVALEVFSTSTGRDPMTSFFYPTDSSCSNFPLAPAYPPLTKAYLLESVGLPPDSPFNVTTQAHLNAPIASTSFPLLFFSPGYGTSRLMYTATAEDLASLGYIVILVDHPLDCPFIEYPDGSVSEANPVENTSYDAYIPFIDARVADIQSVHNALSNSTFVAQIPGISPPSHPDKEGTHHQRNRFRTSHAGILGHSLGGATAASAILANRHRFIAGFNLDGAIIGNVTTLGLSAPFILMSSSGHNRSNDATWAEFWSNLRGFKREMSVEGSLHSAFSDYLVLADDLVAEGVFNATILNTLGSIQGTRMLEIESAYIGTFFDKWIKGEDDEEGLLNGPSVSFPEVGFDD